MDITKKLVLYCSKIRLSPRLHFNLTLSPSLLAINITHRAALSLMPSLPLPPYRSPSTSIHIRPPSFLLRSLGRPPSPSPLPLRAAPQRGGDASQAKPRTATPSGRRWPPHFFCFLPASKKVEGGRRLLLLGKDVVEPRSHQRRRRRRV